MASNSLGKKIFVLGFLLFVLFGIFIWQGNSFSQGYFDWLKTGISRINLLKTSINPGIELSKDSGLDLSEVNLEEIIADRNDSEEEQPASAASDAATAGEEEIIGIGGPVPSEELEQEILVVKRQMTLEEIQQEVNRIAQEVERIDKEVQELINLSGQKINE
ncbi:MAG: hypothetical protein A2V72_02205 [Candidatus Nealsonbacteria bacterium RBG_13_37_56]|uniref:Uncharacterized protein n=1 Tax=Candidatus Nealsonbacteria bacterium RBG_13_37_56 TaxID=1801661 RepID=A0A1G2DXB7_9BACT|nr:MAG: hypothetical protein A2V72_02205 [Candidatus Nealsonbacteria bacterium RBG_13_37_56]